MADLPGSAELNEFAQVLMGGDKDANPDNENVIDNKNDDQEPNSKKVHQAGNGYPVLVIND